MRLRIIFSKTEAMRYTGHLDLHRTWERTFRRARLPLAYSKGFHPQPRLNLACALPLGFTSDCEVLDAWLERDLPIVEIKQAMESASPPGIKIQHLEVIDDKMPALQTQVKSAEYIITLLEPPSDLPECVNRILSADTIPRVRRNKPYDLRPLIEGLRYVNNNFGYNSLNLRMTAQEAATGRPEELLAELGIPFENTRVHRSRLIFRRENE